MIVCDWQPVVVAGGQLWCQQSGAASLAEPA